MDGKKVSKSSKLKKIISRSYFLGVVTCLILVGIVVAVMYLFDFGSVLIGKNYDEYEGMKSRYGKLYEIEEIIGEHGLADYDPEDVDDEMIRGIIKTLDDPYAQYFTKEEYEDYMRNYEDSFVGIGVVVTMSDDGVEVLRVMEDSPADSAGLKSCDIILKVDGKVAEDLDVATDLLRGVAGTEAELVIKRGDKNKEFTITRAKIESKSVYYRKYDKKNKIGYIYIAQFKEGTYDSFKLAVKDLKNDGYKKIIIDLRENGGGLTKEAFKLADYLLPEGKICTEKYKDGSKSVEKSDASSAGIEYVLIVNGHTASSSEILAGAVKDNKGGKIVGTKTYGKGVTQKTYVLSDKSVLKLTISEYYTPKGHKVNGKGITPDIVVENSKDVVNTAHDCLLHE